MALDARVVGCGSCGLGGCLWLLCFGKMFVASVVWVVGLPWLGWMFMAPVAWVARSIARILCLE